MTKYMDIVDLRITHFENSFIPNLTKNMSVSKIKHKFKGLGKSFVFLPSDKAANNVVVMSILYKWRLSTQKRFKIHSFLR